MSSENIMGLEGGSCDVLKALPGIHLVKQEIDDKTQKG
jgi:hypothetical protein